MLMQQLMDRVPSREAQMALIRLRQAFEAAEKEIPGLTSALVLDIVESVEQVEEP